MYDCGESLPRVQRWLLLGIWGALWALALIGYEGCLLERRSPEAAVASGIVIGATLASLVTGLVLGRIPHTVVLLLGCSVIGAFVCQVGTYGPRRSPWFAEPLFLASAVFQVSVLAGILTTVLFQRRWLYAAAVVALVVHWGAWILVPDGSRYGDLRSLARDLLPILAFLGMAGSPPRMLCVKFPGTPSAPRRTDA